MKLPQIKAVKIPVSTGTVRLWTVDGYIALPGNHKNRSLANVVACRGLYHGGVRPEVAAARFCVLDTLCSDALAVRDLQMLSYLGKDREAVVALLNGTLRDMAEINWGTFTAHLDYLRS